jgi:hypothetical protein
LGIARDISKLFSADTSLVTQTELTSALQNVTVDLSGYVTASAVSASIANIDVTSQLDSLIAVQSASPSSSTKIWINTLTASAPTIETFSSGAWRGIRTSNLRDFIIATGGSISTIAQNGLNYKVHTFTSTTNFTVTSGVGQVEYLIIAEIGRAHV